MQIGYKHKLSIFSIDTSDFLLISNIYYDSESSESSLLSWTCDMTGLAWVGLVAQMSTLVGQYF